MRKWQAIPVAGAAALMAAVVLIIGGNAMTAHAGNTVDVHMAVDCDTSTAGIQSTCNIAVASGAAIPVDVILSNLGNTGTQVDSVNYDLFNPQCVTGCVNGNTPNAAGGIGPSVPVVDAGNFPGNYGCGSPPPSADTGSGAPGTSTSFLSCFLNSGTALALPAGGSVRISGEIFSDSVTADTTIILTLSNVASADDNAVTTISCDPASAPPASPEGNVVGPCTPATLIFGTGGSGATPTPLPPTSTPVPTATPCVSNCPTPTSLAFVTITPNAATLTATAPTAAPPTAAPPPPGGEQPGGAPPPTGNQPGGGAGAGSGRPITLPDTGAGQDGGIDWTAASLLALLAVAIGGAAGAMYLGGAQVSASRRDAGDD